MTTPLVTLPSLWTVSVVAHVVSAAVWTGGLVYAAVVGLPAADARDSFVRQTDGLLQLTRLTGVVLPATGLYQVWVAYPLPALFGTPRGHFVVVMALLWALANGTVEVGVLRIRRAVGTVSLVTYFAERFDPPADADPERMARLGRPYVRAAAVGAVLLLADAGLLAAV